MDSQRRTFLLATGLAAATTLAATAARRDAGAVPATELPEDETRGYRVSEHILKYYETTRI